jgi:hypothetical protein
MKSLVSGVAIATVAVASAAQAQEPITLRCGNSVIVVDFQSRILTAHWQAVTQGFQNGLAWPYPVTITPTMIEGYKQPFGPISLNRYTGVLTWVPNGGPRQEANCVPYDAGKPRF